MKIWILRVILCPLKQRMVRSTLFSTTTSPPPDFYPPLRSMSTFSLIVLALRELYPFYLQLASKRSHRYDHILAYLRSPPTTVDHVASLPHAVQLHAATPARIEALLVLRDEATYLGLSGLVELCTAELRRNPNVHLSQLTRTPSHVHAHTRGLSSGSMRSMGTLRERDENDTGADADIGSNTTSRDSTGSAKSLGSARGRGRTRSNPSAAAAAGAGVTATPASAKESKELSPHPTPTPLLHRRLASQSRERPELIEVKSPTLRGPQSTNWL